MELETKKEVDEPRVDALEKVTGRAKYTEDLDIPGVAYGAVLLSPHSHARIVSIDSSKAERFPGVLAVLDREHLEGLNPVRETPKHQLWDLTDDEPFIGVDKVRFDGQLVAAVAAEDLRTAEAAVRMIDVEYEVLPSVFDAEDALSPSAPILHGDKRSNLLLEYRLDRGDVEKGFGEADHVFEETYTSPAMFHYPMENVGTAVAQFSADQISLWAPIASPFPEREHIARFFGVKSDQVRIRVPYVGGHFGAKDLTNSILAALFLSRKCGGRPVKMMPSTQESFRQNSRHAVVYKAKIGVKADGTITALDVNLLADTGAYTTKGPAVTVQTALASSGCYRVPNFRCHARCVYTNKVPAGTLRSVGKFQATWGIECTVDSVARQMGIDPMDFRLKNVLKRGESVEDGAPPLDTDYADLVRRAVEAIQWDGRSPRLGSGSGTARDSRRLARGRAAVIALRFGFRGGGRAEARATLDGDGTVTIQHNAPEVGQGTYSLISVVAAKTLEVPQSQIRVGEPDTSLDLPYAGVSAQRTTIQMGNAVHSACENLKRELIEVAVRLKGGSPTEWRVAEGCLRRGEASYSFAEIVRALGKDSIVKSTGFHMPPPTVKDSPFQGIDQWCPSAGAAEVEVDPETGEFRVLQYAGVVDAGKVLHYDSARGQVEGGAIMGLGHALHEEVVYEDERIQNAEPFQYRLPLMCDVPESFHSLMIENGNGPGPFGSKGMAQTSIPTVAPAIANAIFDAVGVRVRSLPITPEKILEGLGKLTAAR